MTKITKRIEKCGNCINYDETLKICDVFVPQWAVDLNGGCASHSVSEDYGTDCSLWQKCEAPETSGKLIDSFPIERKI